MRKLLARALVVGAIFGVIPLATACGGDSDEGGSSGSGTTGSETSPITVGAAVGLTGPWQPYDATGLNAMKLVFDKVNAAGGINGRKIEVIERDMKSDPTLGAAAAQSLLDEGADILIVSCDFDVGSPAAIVAQNAGKAVFSTCAQSPKFGVQGIGDKAYTAAVSVLSEGAVLANYAVEQGWQKPFLLLDTTIAYDVGLCDGFQKGFEAKNGTIAGKATFKQGDASIAPQITKLKASGADSVVLCTYMPGGASNLRQIRSAGIDLPVLAGVAFDGTFWVKAVRDISNLFVSSHASVFGNDPSEAVNEFVKEYETTYGDKLQSSHPVVSYSVGEAIVKSLKETQGDADGNALRDVLNTFEDEPLLAGPTTFTEEVHIPLDRPMTVLEYTNGEPKAVGRYAPATVIGIGG